MTAFIAVSVARVAAAHPGRTPTRTGAAGWSPTSSRRRHDGRDPAAGTLGHTAHPARRRHPQRCGPVRRAAPGQDSAAGEPQRAVGRPPRAVGHPRSRRDPGRLRHHGQIGPEPPADRNRRRNLRRHVRRGRRLCPVAGSYGGKDRSPMGASAAARLDRAQTALGVDHDFVLDSLRRSWVHQRPRPSRHDAPADRPEQADWHSLPRAAARDAHRRIAAFFRRHLAA